MIIIAAIIIIIAIVLIVWFAFPNPPRTNETIGTVIAKNSIEETTLENKEQNQKANTEVNEIVQEVDKNEQQNSIQETPSSETFEQNPETDEEKAIEIAKKEYGDIENVKFGVEGIQADGRYIVSVRDSNTTEALVYYTIDVRTGNFEKREMN